MKVTKMPPVHAVNLVANSGNIAYGVDVIAALGFVLYECSFRDWIPHIFVIFRNIWIRYDPHFPSYMHHLILH